MTLAQQQRIDKLAVGILLGISILGTFCNYFVKQGFWNPRLSHSGLIILLLLQPFYLWWIYNIGRGRRWAKILYLILTAIGLLFFAFDHKQITTRYLTSPLASVNYISQQVIAFLVGVLLALSSRKPGPAPVASEEAYD